MRSRTSAGTTPETSRLTRLLLPLLLVAVTGGFVGLAAQGPVKKKPPKPEVEDPKPPPLKHIPDPEKRDPKPIAKPVVPPSADLTLAAEQATHPALRELFRSLRTPHDLVTMRLKGTTNPVEPVAVYVGSKPEFRGTIRVRRYNADWLPTTTLDINKNDISGIEPYERLAVARVEHFLKDKDVYSRLPEKDPRYLTRAEMLRAAADTLTAVVRFHESARAKGERVGEGWNDVEEALRRKLLAVELEYLDALVALNDWETAVATARRLAGAFQRTEDRKDIARPLTELIERSLKRGDDAGREVQGRLKLLDELFPGLNAAQRISDGLRGQAERLFEQAKQLDKKKQHTEAQELLRRAEEIYPRLPDLHDYRLRQAQLYPVLRVGVRDLPVSLSPALACTDAERWAVELLFEGLVKLLHDPETGPRYEPGLAAGRPATIFMGRQFQLARDTFWSSDRRVGAADVRATVRLLKDPAWPGYRPAWAELIEDVQLGGDPSQVSLHLRQGFLDPLALMTFKVLPQELSRKNLAEFDRNPVGSGPYQYGRVQTRDGRRCAVFTASANYGSRPGKRGLPYIREVLFFKSDNPARDFEKGLLDLLLDVPGKQVKELERLPGVTVPPPLPNRRVYFLAVNHRRPALQNQDLRRALGLAVPRETILDDFFRPEPGKGVHRALNGPYPAGSWACDPNVPALDRPELAKGLLKQAEQKGTLPKKLSLKFPNDDPQVTQAMAYLGTHLTNELGIELEPEPLDPRALRDAVELTHNYDLAYYHYDFPSDAYWLWPLFDPSPRAREGGGGNYLGYGNDSDLERWFREAMSHRDFNKVQERARLIHGVVEGKMLLIPLWQLDTLIAHRDSLKPVGLDPLLIFTAIEHWQLGQR